MDSKNEVYKNSYRKMTSIILFVILFKVHRHLNHYKLSEHAKDKILDIIKDFLVYIFPLDYIINKKITRKVILKYCKENYHYKREINMNFRILLKLSFLLNKYLID